MRCLDKTKLYDNVQRRVAADIENGWVDNVTLAVWQDGQEVLKESFGNADERTVYRMASMTKPITTVAAMIMVERGLLQLDDLVETYLPAFADRMVAIRNERGEVVGTEPARTKLTVRHLLCHTSGHWYGEGLAQYPDAMTEEDCRTLENAVATYATFPLAFHPTESQAYSGTIAWDILVSILQRTAGEDFQAFLTREIFVPCEMTDTTFVPTDEQWARMVPMHNRVDGKCVEEPRHNGCVFENIPCTHYLGGAGLISTLSDYVNFALMLQNGGVYNGRRILSEASIREIATPQLSPSANPGSQPWGLGVRVIRGEEYHRLPAGSFGWSGAYGTHFWVDPENRITAVYMKNSVFDGGSGALTSAHFEEDVYNALL